MLITNSNLQLLCDTFSILDDYTIQVSPNNDGNSIICAISDDMVISYAMDYIGNQQFSLGSDDIMDIVDYINELDVSGISKIVYSRGDRLNDNLRICAFDVKLFPIKYSKRLIFPTCETCTYGKYVYVNWLDGYYTVTHCKGISKLEVDGFTYIYKGSKWL